MQRNEFLKSVEKQIDGVLEDTRFLSDTAQIRAKATLIVIAQYYVGFTEAFLAISVDNLVISLFPEKISLM
jgi:hypothetical protein